MLNYPDSQKRITSSPTNLQSLAGWLRVLAEPKRLLILDLLMQGVQCNCELGEALHMAPNLISHHLHALRQADLVKIEHDALDARWIYYSINRQALDELNTAFSTFFNPNRVQPRHPSCGPQGMLIKTSDIGIFGG